MNGFDTLKNDGNFECPYIISNNSKPGQENVIFTDRKIKLNGSWYKPGDTCWTTSPRNITNKILITDCKGTSLPVNLIEFKYSNGNLTWKTGVESNISNYEVMMSKDGSVWNSIGKVNAYNVQGSQYSFKIYESALYRLKVNEIGEETSYSPTVNVKIDGPDGITFSPNPVKDKLKVVSSNVVKSIDIFNLSGQLVKSVNFYEISLNELPPSFYVLKVTDESGQVYIDKFLKD